MKPNTPRRTRPLVVITGTPGTGKTTVSKLLARQLQADYLSLTKLVISKRLHASLDRRRRTRVVDLEKTRAWLRESLRKKMAFSILDTHIPDVAPEELVRKVVVLRSNPMDLERRLRKKGWSKAKCKENVLAEILDSCYIIATQYYSARKVLQLNTSRTSVSKTVNQCKRLLTFGAHRSDRIDWLATLDRRALEKYL